MFKLISLKNASKNIQEAVQFTKQILKNVKEETSLFLIDVKGIVSFAKLAFVKETSTQVLPCEICENFKNTFFTEQFQTAASELKTLPPGNREEIERT